MRLLIIFVYFLGIFYFEKFFYQQNCFAMMNRQKASRLAGLQPLPEVLPPPLESDEPQLKVLQKTRNHMGDAVSSETEVIRYFLQEAPRQTILDLGCAFGGNTEKALKQGATHITAIDLDVRHLESFKQRIIATYGEQSSVYLSKVQLIQGSAPALLTSLQNNSFDSILFSHVLHYMAPEEIDQTLVECMRILKPGGKIFIQALMINSEPYPFDLQLRRALLKAQPVSTSDTSCPKKSWPTFLTKDEFSGPMRHPQDPGVLREALIRHHFALLNIGTYSMSDKKGSLNPLPESYTLGGSLKGDACGVIAVKP